MPDGERPARWQQYVLVALIVLGAMAFFGWAYSTP